MLNLRTGVFSFRKEAGATESSAMKKENKKSQHRKNKSEKTKNKTEQSKNRIFAKCSLCTLACHGSIEKKKER